MSRDIQEGRIVQLRGRVKRAWAALVGDEPLAAEGNADVIAGTIQESFGVAKKQTARELSRGVDTLAGALKRAAKSLER